MLDWIAGFVARWTPVVSNGVRDLVHWGLHALASVVYFVFGAVGKAWNDVVTAIAAAYDQAKRFVTTVGTALEFLIRVYVPRVLAQAEAWWHDALSTAHALAALILADLKADIADITAFINDVRQFAITHILVPLTAAIEAIKADIVKYAVFAYNLVTHPDQLAAILIRAMITAAEDIFWDIAEPAGEFALRVVTKNLARWLHLIETIIAAVL